MINITRHRKPDADDVYYPHSALGLVWLLLRLRGDVVHLHIGGMLTNRLLALACVCSLLPRRKVVLTFHSGGYPSTPEGRNARPNSLAGFAFRRLDGLIGVNPEIINFFTKLGVPKDRAHLIYPHAILQEDIAENLSQPLNTFTSAHDPVLISVGLLEPEYDLHLQINILETVRRDFSNAGLVIIGSGSLEPELRQAIARNACAEHILLTGDVPHPVTMRAIQRSDVMLRTTLHDGDAVSVREALYLGTPVIATDNGMRPAEVRLIPKRDREALRLAIAQALAQPKSARVRADAGEDNLRAVLQLYEQLLRR